MLYENTSFKSYKAVASNCFEYALEFIEGEELYCRDYFLYIGVLGVWGDTDLAENNPPFLSTLNVVAIYF